MLKNWRLIALLISLAAGAVLIIYLFAKEDLENLGEATTGNTVKIPVEGEPMKETLLLSLFYSPIDFDGHMAKLRTEGFENNYFIADVAAVDIAGQKLTLTMNFPTDGGFETEEKIVTINCPTKDTAVLARVNLELLKENAKLLEEVNKNDLLVSYCLDSTCSSVGRECILVKTSRNE